MSQWLKQSTAATVKMGPFVDDTDFKTAETGLTISQADIRLSKNGGDYAQTNNAAGATHDEAGEYDVPLDTTDTNTLGRLRVRISESGALPVWQDFMVVPANVWDSMFGSDKLQVDGVEFNGSAITSASGRPEVNLTHWKGTAPLDLTSQLVQAQANQLGTQAKADVNAEADTALADYDGPTHAELTSEVDDVQADIAALNDLSAAQVNAEVDAALADARLDELLAADSDIDGAAPPAVGSVVHELMSKSTGSFTYDQTTDSLEAIRDKAADIETDTQDIQSKIGTPAGASVSADIAAVKDDTGDAKAAAEANQAILEELTEDDGGGNLRYTEKALEQAPTGEGGSGDWSTGERAQIRQALGIDGSKTATSGGNLDAVKTKTDQLAFTSNNVHSHTKAQDNLGLTDQQKLDVNAEVDSALNTAVPGSPVADSINERIKTLDDNYTAARAANLDATISSRATPAQVNSEVDTALADYDGPTHAELVSEVNAVQSDIAALNNLSAAQVNAEVVDALNVDTYAEPGQEAPGATISLAKKIGYLYKAFRNKFTQTATEASLFADNGSTVDQKATVSDDGTTFTRGEMETGP